MVHERFPSVCVTALVRSLATPEPVVQPTLLD
jgi:hypothetical protein